MKKHILICTFLIVALTNSCATVNDQLRERNDDSVIYSTFINYYIDNFLDKKIENFVVSINTERPDILYESDPETISIFLKHLPIIDTDLFNSFKAKNSNSVKIQRNIKSQYPIEYLGKEQIKEFFTERNWDKFKSTYQRSQGLMSFSQVGYSGDGMKALLYYGNSCGMKCGGGGFVVFQKVKASWEVLVVFPIWIS